MSHAFSGVIGHEAQTAYLQAILDAGRISHAYCFSGSRSLGKGTIARRFAAAAAGIDPERLQASPDIFVVDLPTDEKTGELKSIIPVEAIRSLREQLQLSSFGSAYKVAIIEHADRMNVQAQNALLKTLEEPRSGTLIILLAQSPERLLPTILSRVVHLRFPLVPREAICHALREKGLDQNMAHETAGLAAGRPGEAIRLLDAEYKDGVVGALEQMASLRSLPIAEAMARAEAMAKQESRRDLQQMLGFLTQTVHDELLAVSGGEAWMARSSIQPRGDIQKIARSLRAIEDVRRAIDQNVAAGTALEHIILESSSL